MRALCLSAIAALTVVYAAHAGLIERPSSPDESPNRFVINDGALAISRPDESWKFEIDASEPPVVARMSSPDAAAVADIQVQQVPDALLAHLKEPIEQAIATEAQDFNKLSGRDVEVNGIAAYELIFTLTQEGTPRKVKMLVYKPRDTLYIVKCSSSAKQWKRFEPECDTVLASFELLSEQRRRFVPTVQYEKRSIEGWTIYVNKDLLADDTELGSKALRLLETKLYEVGRVVPDKAREVLRRVPIWLGVDDGHAPGAEYHPSHKWLREHGYNPDKAKSVEIGNASLFLRWSLDQPSMVLHELAHAYHDRVLGDHAGLRAAFRAAVEGGRYETVLRANGREERAYAIENDREYFAEGTEAFFGTNDFYPFVRAELRRHDPKLFEVLEEVFGTSATPTQGLPSAEIEWPAGLGKVTIPFDYENGFIVVPVSVMGSRPLQMMLSTGSPLIVIPDESLAETMDLNIVDEVQVDGDGDGEMQTAPLAMGVDAVVGGLKISNGSVLVGAVKELLQGVDGAIGASIFRNCVVEINWTDRELHLHDPATHEYDGNGVVLDLTVAADGHPYVDGFTARLGGPNWTELKLRLDSGDRGALTLYAGSDEQIKIPEGAVESIITWGSRGPARGFLSRIDTLKIGSTELSALPTSFSETYNSGEPGVPEHDGRLGLIVLERFNILIDYPGGRLILEPTKESARPFSTNTTGVSLAPGKAGADRLEIAHVIADSPASKIGVRQGDSIMEVNGKPVASMKYDEIRNVWRSEPGAKLRLTIERDGSPVELLLTAATFF